MLEVRGKIEACSDAPEDEIIASKKPHLEIMKSSSATTEIGLSQNKLDKLNEWTSKNIEAINKRVFNGEITIFDSAIEMGKLTRKTLIEIAHEFASLLGVEITELPFAIFVFGATARNLMLPNSDLDVALIFADNCPEAIKSSLRHTVSTLPFNDETDIAHLESLEDMRKKNCRCLMETNKAVEARFVVGNISIAEGHKKLMKTEDSLKDKEERFITEYWLLHKFDYGNRSTDHGMNLKYDFGGSRDLVFLDWYHALKNSDAEVSENEIISHLCLDLLLKDSTISQQEYIELESALELVLLVKFALWNENIRSKDKKLLHLNDSSIDKCFQSTGVLLKKRGINNEDELTYAYYRTKGQLHNLVVKLYEKVVSLNPASRELWENAKEATDLNEEVLKILKNSTWHKLVPFAIRSTSPEILRYIVKRFGNVEGYEYIMRIISQNKCITEEIKEDLLKSRLDKRFTYKLNDK